MVKKKITQFKIGKINLIAYEIDLIVCQESFAGRPGIIAAGTLFKNRHIHTVLSRQPVKKHFYILYPIINPGGSETA